ncbi:MAG: fibronectin type III domain-containing protein [Chitinophagaceae bacterium]
MKKNLLFVVLFTVCGAFTLKAQNVFNPTDPLVNYNPANPPAIPPPNTLAKWVRTPRPEVNFNTDRFKSYYYNGMPFRLRYPNGYNPNDPNKKYPVILFFHGIGEAAIDYDNEINLLYSGPIFENRINEGQFDAFLLFPQTDVGDWSPSFPNVNAVLDLLELYCHADPDRLITMGLSLGGDGTMKYTFDYPKRSALSIPSSPGSISTFTQDPSPFIHIPFWVASGGLDDQFSTPASVQAFVDRFTAAGGDIRWSYFPTIGHGTWVEHWNQPFLVPYWQAAHKANPLVFYKKTDFPSNTPVNARIGITGGFAEYQWQKNNIDIPGAGSNEITATQPGTYRVRFRRVPGGIWSDWSPNPAVITQPVAPDNIAPTAPANLHVVSVTTTSILLDWDNSTDNVGVTGYDVFVNGTKQYSTTSSDVAVTNLNPATSYTFTVQAHDQANNYSAFSNSVNSTTATAPDVTAPTTPANLHVVSVTTNSITLDWDNSTDNVGVTGYDVFVNGTKQYSTTNSDVVANNLNPATSYTFTVQAHDQSNNFSAFSNSVNGITATAADITAPTIPANLHVVSVTTNSITLDWDNSTDNVGVTGYDVFVNGTKQYSTTNSDVVANNLNPATTYTFTVKAHDQVNNLSGFSNAVNGTTTGITPPTDNAPPGAPSNLHVVSATTGSITLDWDNSIDNVGVAGYDVFINGAKTYATTNSDFVVGGLSSNTTYTFMIQAHDAANNYSAFSNLVNGTTASVTPPVDNIPPTIPANLHVVSINTNAIALDWDNSTDNIGVTGYDVFVNGTKLYSTVSSDVVAGSLNPGTTYTFTVQARDQANNLSVFSNSINGTTTTVTPVNDHVPPTGPSNLHVVSATNNSITLDWDNSIDNVGVAGYDVFINGAKTYATVNSDYVVGSLGANTSYTFRIQAHDVANNYSEFSNLASGATTGVSSPDDHVPPTGPGNLHVVTVTGNSVTLDWDNSIDNVGVAGYDVFVNGVKSFATVNSDFVVGNLVTNTTYTFRIQAHDGANNYSEFSNQASGTPSGSTNPIGALTYKFYQGSFSALPNFTALTPVQTGTSSNIDISVRPPGVNDQFAFLWEGNITIPVAGTYTFETVSDDGSKLYFNKSYSVGAIALVNNDGLHATASASGTIDILAAGSYPIAISFFEQGGGEVMEVYWSGPGIPRTRIPNTAFTANGNPPPVFSGLNYKYYEGTWNSLPNFSLLTPVKTGTSSTTDITVRTPGRNDNFGFLWEGYINITTPGVYTFETVSDDGSKLYFGSTYSFGGAAVVNSDGLHPAFPVAGTVNIPSAGLYPIVITFFEQSGGETMEVYWTGPGIGRQLIPGSAFRLNNSAIVSAQSKNGTEQSAARLNAEMGNIEMQSIYPNPFTNSFTIYFNNATAGNKITVDLVDVSGRLLFKQNFGNMAAGATTLKMNVGNKGMLPGVYFARLNINGKPMKLMKLVRK